MFLSQITVFMQLSPLLIPWDYIHKETQARLPWGHKVPDGQIKSTMLLSYYYYSIETTCLKLFCDVKLLILGHQANLI